MSGTNDWMKEPPPEWKELRDRFNGSRVQVYCTNGSRLVGIISFISTKWIEIVRDDQRSALVNLEYVVSIAFDNAPS